MEISVKVREIFCICTLKQNKENKDVLFYPSSVFEKETSEGKVFFVSGKIIGKGNQSFLIPLFQLNLNDPQKQVVVRAAEEKNLQVDLGCFENPKTYPIYERIHHHEQVFGYDDDQQKELGLA